MINHKFSWLWPEVVKGEVKVLPFFGLDYQMCWPDGDMVMVRWWNGEMVIWWWNMVGFLKQSLQHRVHRILTWSIEKLQAWWMVIQNSRCPQTPKMEVMLWFLDFPLFWWNHEICVNGDYKSILIMMIKIMVCWSQWQWWWLWSPRKL